MKKSKVFINRGGVWNSGTLYVGVENVRGGWILSLDWYDTQSLNELEESGDEELLSIVFEIMGNPFTPWEECDDLDQFRTETYKMFFLNPAKN